MEKLFLVMLLPAIVIPASAKVLVYTMSEKEISFQEELLEWSIEKESIKGYLILEDTGDTTGNMWFISTFKGGGLKLAGAEQLDNVQFFGVEIGNKKTIFVTYSNIYRQLFLKGQEKLTKIGDESWSITTKLTGSAIWNYNENPGEGDIGSANLSLTLNKKYTVDAKNAGADAEAEKNAIMDILKGQGYDEITPNP